MSYDARKGKIITEFIECNGLVTAEYLSKKIGVSSRTIRSDIKLINEELEIKGISIKSKPKIGYAINPFDAMTITVLKKYITEEKCDIAISPEDRVFYILRKLLQNNRQFITLEGLANELYVSKSTIDNDTEKVEKWLNRYNLRLLRKPNYGMKILGNELQLRYLISNYLKDTKQKSNKKLIQAKYIENMLNIKTDIIKNIILDVYKDESLKLSDIAFQNLIMHIAVAINRIEENKEIDIPVSEINKLKNSKEYNTAKKIVKELEKEFHVDIPESENAYITIHLLGIKALKDDEFNINNLKSDIPNELLLLIQNMIQEIKNVYKIDFSNDEELVYGLALHLRPTINRLRNNMSIRNPLLDDVKEEYPYAFDMAISASKILEQYSSLSINENEIGYLAMHIGAALERKEYTEGREIKRVSIICATGMGTAQLLASKIKKLFRDVVIIGIYPSYKSKEVVLKKPDLILATVPVDINEIPVIQVSSLFNKEDIHKINNVFNNLGQLNKKYKLYELFDKELFITGIKEKDRYEVIKTLSNILYEKNCVNETFIQSAIDREKISATSTGNLLAIPHAFSGNVITSRIAVGILDKPIQWGENMVQIVFLLALEKMSSEDYENIFNTLYSIVADRKKILTLINSDSFKDFIKLLKVEN